MTLVICGTLMRGSQDRPRVGLPTQSAAAAHEHELEASRARNYRGQMAEGTPPPNSARVLTPLCFEKSWMDGSRLLLSIPWNPFLAGGEFEIWLRDSGEPA